MNPRPVEFSEGGRTRYSGTPAEWGQAPITLDPDLRTAWIKAQIVKGALDTLQGRGRPAWLRGDARKIVEQYQRHADDVVVNQLDVDRWAARSRRLSPRQLAQLARERGPA